MDRGIWATWYDLAADVEEEYLDWLHGHHLSEMLSRHDYLWAAHVKNVDWPEREQHNQQRLVHTDDPAVPAGFHYLLMFGAAAPHTFVDPSPAEVLASQGEEARRMLGLQDQARSSMFAEVARTEGPSSSARAPGITPGPVIQFGTFNVSQSADEIDMNTWYSRSRLPLVQSRDGNVGARRVVSIAGWPRHGILYEFTSLEHAQKNLVDPSEWTKKVVDGLVHAPHSPTLGVRIWPPVGQGE